MQKFIKNNYIMYKFENSEIDKIDFALCKQPTETIDSYYNRQDIKPTIICNGGLFTLKTGDTEFTYQDNGKLISYREDIPYGFAIHNGKLFYSKYDKSYNDFISGYPVLLNNGVTVKTWVGSELNYLARRTVLGYNNDYVFLMLVEDPGMNFPQIVEVLKSYDVLYAINLDGGGSTRCLEKGKLVTNKTIYNRPVDNVLCIYLKNIIYRVQTGAFMSQANAIALCEKIKNLPNAETLGYKNAYVRKIGLLYKVQVGAFTNKDNAQRMLDNLKSNGLNPFITTE